MHKRFNLVAILTAASLLTGAAHAQQATKSNKGPVPTKMAQQQQGETAPPPSAGWAARCSSVGRAAPLECAIEQSAVLAKTGQLIILFNIRVPGDTRAPIALVQLPLGLNLGLGAKLQIDGGKTFDLPIQTCENRGCYASTPISTDLLAAMKSGTQLKVSFQNMTKETITIPMQLNDFASAYDRIK